MPMDDEKSTFACHGLKNKPNHKKRDFMGLLDSEFQQVNSAIIPNTLKSTSPSPRCIPKRGNNWPVTLTEGLVALSGGDN